MDMTKYILMVGVGLVFVVLWFRERRRSIALRAMAERRGFVYLGGALPGSLRLRGTPIAQATSVWNVIDGDCDGFRVVTFDCRIGSGKHSSRRTVIAARGPDTPFSGVSPDFTVGHSGDWSILYQPESFGVIPPGLMPVGEIEAYFDSMRSPKRSRKEVSR